MSAGGFEIPRCGKCGVETLELYPNELIGGRYCLKCHQYITKPDPKLEAKYNRRVAARKAKENA